MNSSESLIQAFLDFRSFYFRSFDFRNFLFFTQFTILPYFPPGWNYKVTLIYVVLASVGFLVPTLTA